jgi:hypothetical protein
VITPSKKAALLIPAALALLSAGAAQAETPTIQLKNPAIGVSPTGVKTPPLQLKPDLIIERMGFNAEFCHEMCSDTWSRELRLLRMSQSCQFQVTVKNIGAGPSQPGQVRVEYQSVAGTNSGTGSMPGLRPGESKIVPVGFNTSRVDWAYFNFYMPFRGMADSTNTSAETNEGNNTKEIRIRP